jgi:hypothetical protein
MSQRPVSTANVANFIRWCFVFALFLSKSVRGDASTISLDVEPGDKRCVGQELDDEDSALFQLRNLGSNTKRDIVGATLQDPDGEVLKEGMLKPGQSLELKLNVEKSGLYEICFTKEGGGMFDSSDKVATRVSFLVDYKSRGLLGSKHGMGHGFGGLDPSTKVEKDELPALESMLLEAEESLTQISKELEYARKQELSLLQAGEAAATRIQWFGWLSIIILLTTSMWQIIYLRQFFTAKKLL